MAKQPGKHTYKEILSQPASWQQTWALVQDRRAGVAALWSQGRWAQTLLTGCGSPYYLAMSAASLLRDLTGRVARAVPASELWLNPQGHYTQEGETLLVAISRSGETTEVLQAVRAFRDAGRGKVLVITCEPESALYALGDLSIGLPWASEKSIAQTRSFASMWVAAAATAAIWAEREDLLGAMGGLPAVGERLLAEAGDLAQRLGANTKLKRFYFLGSGSRYGLASEASLKMKEMTLSHSEPFHVLEFRHGPKSMVNKRTLVVALLSETQQAHEAPVLQEMRDLGGKVLALAEGEVAQADHLVRLGSGLPESIRGVLYLPALHLMAYHRALAKGLDPDSPTNLDAVVRLGHA